MLRFFRSACLAVASVLVSHDASALPTQTGLVATQSPPEIRFAQAGGQRCLDIQIATEPLPAARSLVRMLSPCLEGQVVSIRHADLVFTGLVNSEGRADVIVPLLKPGGEAQLELTDGGILAIRLAHRPEDFDRLFRVVLSWRQNVDLALHVLEFTSAWNSEGHIWRENPKSFDAIRAAGGGFLETVAAAAPDYESHDIYTYWATGGARGVVQIAVDYAGRGAVPQPPACGGNNFAAPRYRLTKSLQGKLRRPQKRRIASAPCGATLTPENRLVTRPTDDLRIVPAR